MGTGLNSGVPSSQLSGSPVVTPWTLPSLLLLLAALPMSRVWREHTPRGRLLYRFPAHSRFQCG